jgi:hypothetical protein
MAGLLPPAWTSSGEEIERTFMRPCADCMTNMQLSLF